MPVKLRFNLASDLFEALPEIRRDVSCEPADTPSLEYMAQLTSSQTPENAITFCAYLLPRREAVWWGHQCLSLLPQIQSPTDPDYLQLAENWVRNPEEPERNLALNAASQADPKTPAVWVALAAGWSGGSMVGEDMNPVPPPPFLTAKAINAGLLTALALVDTDSRRELLGQFVSLGSQLAAGN